MKRQTRNSRSLAALALLLGTSACSGIAAQDQSAGDEIGDGIGEGEGDSDESASTGGSDDADPGTDTSGDDEGTSDTSPEEGVDDPQLVTPICDPQQDQVIAYDLVEAHAEIAPELVRQSVLNYAIVPQIPLSPRPFFNHFRFEHPPANDTTLAITGELWKPQMILDLTAPRYQLQFAVSGPMIADEQRPSVDLAVVVDIGPSMVGLPLELADEALAAVSSSLRAGDRITLISAGDQAELISTTLVEDGFEPSLPSMLAGTLADDPPAGGTAIHEALALAYAKLGELDPLPEAQSRVMLISAGHFAADVELIELVDSAAELDTTLTCVGVGASDQFADGSLRALAAVGKGASVYGPNADQLWLDLGEQFTAKMISSATDVEVTLILPPGLAVSERDPSWGGNELALETELASLGPNDSLVFHQELVSCGELDPAAAIRVEVQWIEPGLAETQQLVWDKPVADLGFGAMTTRKGAAVLAYTDALVAYRDGLDADARYGALLDALGHISAALESMPADPDLIEMSEVLAKLEST